VKQVMVCGHARGQKVRGSGSMVWVPLRVRAVQLLCTKPGSRLTYFTSVLVVQ
jgi:hypothetical protein